MSDLRLVTLSVGGDRSLIRSATFEGRPQLVVPVIALVGDSVFRPLHSDGPEFVPLSLLEQAPGSWDGRPIVANHPANGTESANTPKNRESLVYGAIYNTRVDDKKLKMDVWLDRERATAIGGDAALTIELLDAGQMVEVSVGARTILVRDPGVSPTGVAYEYRWDTAVWPDHLATLPQSTGACSIEDGCGALRAAQLKEFNVTKEEIGALTRMFTLHSTSDGELRSSLDKALYESEPGFQAILDVYADESYVVYVCSDSSGGYHLYRARYASDDSGTISFTRKTEVVAKTKYEVAEQEPHEPKDPEDETEPVAATAKAACRCHEKADSTSDGNGADLAQVKGATMATDKQKELVGTLLANEAAPYDEADRATLETYSEERLAAIVKAFEPVAVPTEADKRAALPENLQRMLAKAEKQEADQRKSVIAALTADPKAKRVYKAEKLEAMTTDELVDLATALDLVTVSDSGVDFSIARPFASAESTDEPREIPAPYTAALEARKAKGQDKSAN